MSLQEAIAQQPQWIGWWLIWLTFGAFLLPFALLFWRSSRIAGAAGILASVASAYGVGWVYDRLGYVKLLGVPHILFWTPLAIYLIVLLRRGDLPVWPRRDHLCGVGDHRGFPGLRLHRPRSLSARRTNAIRSAAGRMRAWR